MLTDKFELTFRRRSINEPGDAVYDQAKTLFARAQRLLGMSLSDYLLAEIKEIAERPTLTELRDRLHKRKPVSALIDTALLVREEREAR